MKKLIVSLFFFSALSTLCYAEQQQFSDQQKSEKTTSSFIKLLDSLVEKNVITAAHLQCLHDEQELINPMTAEDRAISSTNLVYAKGLDSFIAQGKQFIDLARVKEWLVAKIAELQYDETTRKEVHEDTREIHRPMRFIEIPAGKYVDQITNEEFEIPEGAEFQDTPVTQWQWVEIMGTNPAVFVDGIDSDEIGINGQKIRPDAPVENVSWNDVQNFISRINEIERDYAYALPSVGEYQMVIQSFKQNGSFAEYQGKRLWNIVGKIWQWTRDTVEYREKNAHLVFGGKREIRYAKDTVRPVVYDQSKGLTVGLRLIRYKKRLSCDQKINNYKAHQLAWNQADVAHDSVWQWDTVTQILLCNNDGLQWMFEYKNEYPAATQHTLDVLLKEVPPGKEDVEYLINLTAIYLTNKQIQDVSPLAHLTNLIYLRLEYNQIQDLSPLAHLTNLTMLSLAENSIQDVSPLVGLTNLTGLILTDNQLQDIGQLAHLTNLNALYLDNNQIQDISPLTHLMNLTRLYLSNNKIQNISSLAHLTNLIVLDLPGNQIQDVSPLAYLTNITRLDLYNNPISILSNSANPVIQKEEAQYRCSHLNLRNCYYQYIAPFFQHLSYEQKA